MTFDLRSIFSSTVPNRGKKPPYEKKLLAYKVGNCIHKYLDIHIFYGIQMEHLHTVSFKCIFYGFLLLRHTLSEVKWRPGRNCLCDGGPSLGSSIDLSKESIIDAPKAHIMYLTVS